MTDEEITAKIKTLEYEKEEGNPDFAVFWEKHFYLKGKITGIKIADEIACFVLENKRYSKTEGGIEIYYTVGVFREGKVSVKRLPIALHRTDRSQDRYQFIFCGIDRFEIKGATATVWDTQGHSTNVWLDMPTEL